jgi:hypothetical protein
MKRIITFFAVAVLSGLPAFAASLGTAAKTVVPQDIQQIISVDYRTLRDSQSGRELKEKVLPENLKQFQDSLKSVGIDADKDVDQLIFASYRVKSGLQTVGIAQGQFAAAKIKTSLKTKKVQPSVFHKVAIYPMSGGMSMALLDDFTMLFGEPASVKTALQTRDGELPSMTSNGQFTDMIASVESDPIWSVLDQQGTQFMMKSALGEAAQLADYDTVKTRLKGSYYKMDLANGVKFDLTVTTSDTLTAATLSSLLKAGALYKKMNASPAEKAAIDSMTVDSDSGKLKLKFEADDKKFATLLNSELFSAVSK